MDLLRSATGRSFLVPKVIRPIAKESGIASLEAVLKGFSQAVESAQLQEALDAVQDRPSMDNLEAAANQFGLEVEQVMLPADQILTEESNALPAIIAFRQLNNRTNFVVAWSQFGPLIQVMDPLQGRRWLTKQQFLDEVYVHTHPITAQAWRDWAASDEFKTGLTSRLRRLDLSATDSARLIETALDDPGWYASAALDAIARLVSTTLRITTPETMRATQNLLEDLFQQAQTESTPLWSPATNPDRVIVPAHYWTVLPFSSGLASEPGQMAHLQETQQTTSSDNRERSPAEGTEQLLLRGAVLLRIHGRQLGWAERATDQPTDEDVTEESASSSEPDATSGKKPDSTHQNLWQLLRSDGVLVPSVLAVSLFTATAALILEAVLLQGIMRVSPILNLFGQRLGGIIMLFIFFLLIVLLEIGTFDTLLHLGRRIEARLRISFFEKIPRLSSQYFYGRPIADLVQRAFSITEINLLPSRGGEFLEKVSQLILTIIGIIWLDPGNTIAVFAAIILYIAILWISFPMFVEKNIHFRLAINDLRSYSLDALMGLIPIRTHGAERALRRAFEGKLVTWSKAFDGLNQVFMSLQVSVSLLYSLVAAWILFSYISRGGEVESLLLLAYWTLTLPDLLRETFSAVTGYASMTGLAQMLYEPLNAPDEFETEETPETNLSDSDEPQTAQEAPEFLEPIAISLQGVTLQLMGETVLDNIDLEIRAGEHIGIVGPSGAGKSTLVGLLLGWYRPVSGRILINGRPLGHEEIRALRHKTAWVDPAIQIWNRPLLDNLLYGIPADDTLPLARIVEQADLSNVLERLPDGLRTQLGEAGGMLSGGEGQRVRLGRAMLRRDISLVILDEPFRGLDRGKRRELLIQSRQFWQDTTLVCITHDVGEIQGFERVLVVEGGRIVEDGTPEALVTRPDSRYNALLQAEESVRAGLWTATDWRRLWLAEGQLSEEEQETEDA